VTQGTELLPGWRLVVEESTSNHWVASCRDVVLLVAYEGSSGDVRHIETATRVIERVGEELGPTVKVLFVLPPVHAKPPSAEVRSAVTRDFRRIARYVLRAALVVAGSGFGAAVHRGAATGVLALVRPAFPVKIHRGLEEGLAYLLGSEHEALKPLARCCEPMLFHAPV
jgi:hypothetical protein